MKVRTWGKSSIGVSEVLRQRERFGERRRYSARQICVLREILEHGSRVLSAGDISLVRIYRDNDLLSVTIEMHRALFNRRCSGRALNIDLLYVRAKTSRIFVVNLVETIDPRYRSRGVLFSAALTWYESTWQNSCLVFLREILHNQDLFFWECKLLTIW